MAKIKIVRLDNEANIPKMQSSRSAGYDIHSLNDVEIKAKSSSAIKTGLALQIPDGIEGQIRSRSGLAFNNNISVLNSPGTIDSDYRGEIRVILFNHGDEDYKVNKGERIAQIIFNRIEKVKFEEVEELSETARGTAGFGSTG